MPGFDFSNYNRNAALHARGVPLPKATSTGTTIVGCIFDGGVVVRVYSTTLTCKMSLELHGPFSEIQLFRIRTTPSFIMSSQSLTGLSIQIAADTRATSGPIVADKVR